MRAVCGDGYFEGEGEEMAFFFCEHGYISFYLTIEERRINTDESYLYVCVCKRRVRSGTLH